MPEKTKPIPQTEVWYCWRELETVEGEEAPRLLVPRSDPYRYEFPFDFVFETATEAVAGLESYGIEPEDSEDWILCKMIIEPTARPKK